MRSIVMFVLISLLCVPEAISCEDDLPKIKKAEQYCAGGYLFILTPSGNGGVIATQVYRDGGGPLAKPHPKKCES